MERIHTKIGEHFIQITSNSSNLMHLFKKNDLFQADAHTTHPHILLHIEEGYGAPFLNYEVTVIKKANKVFFYRADYVIETDAEYKTAKISVYNELALKHALMNLYSSYIVYHNWGLLIHSSCVIEKDKAHIFAGPSGAGKSTAAKLSYPRKLLSDEATLVKITSDGIHIFNSPFRSELETKGSKDYYLLESIHLLHQALQNRRSRLSKSNAFLHLMDKVFYWSHNPNETRRVIELLKILVDAVPVHDLHFQKNNTFWELIS